MANLPANPGQALWIGGVAGKNHANIGIGQGTSNGAGDHTDYSQSSIEDGSSPPIDANKFFLNSDGNPVFRINASAGTTTANTKHPRTECRETTLSGGNAAWDGRSGDHYLRARVRIIQVTTNRPWICFGQIHGSSSSPNTSDVIRLQTEGTNGTSTNLSLIARRTPPNGGSEIRTVLRTGYNVGTWFDYEIRQTNGTITVKIDGVTALTATGMGEIDQYFKYGCYLQDSLGEGAASGDWGAVEFQRGSVQVWHTGYPTPTTPVFTGGTDPAGGAGGGPTNDTQPPTVPQNLVAIRGNTQAALSWSPSTDNVGVDHYNIYRFSASGAAGGDGTSSTLGSTVNGADTTLSSADKLIASKAIASASGTLTAGHFRAWLDATGSALSKMAVYADSGGAPGAKLATSDEITISATSESVRDYTFSGSNQIAITAGTTYWVAATWKDPGTPNLTYSRDVQTGGRVELSGITYGTVPNPFGTPTGTFSGPIDAWCDVVSGTGAGTGGGGTTASFGKTTDGASSSASSADKTAVSSATASANGTLVAGHARVWVTGGTATTKCVIYADSAGAPGARLATSDPLTITNTAEALQNYTFSGADQIAITSGTTYWVGLAWQDPGTDSVNISRDGTASARQEVAAYAPTPFGTPTAQSGPIDVYLDTTSGTTGGTSGTFVLLTTTTATSYTNTGLTNGTAYTYAVAATDAAGNESAKSDPVTVIPGPPDTTPPTVPQNVTAVAQTGRVTLTWSASTDPGSTGPAGTPLGTDTKFTERFDEGTSTPFGAWASVQNHTVDSVSASGYSTATTYSQTIVSAGTGHPDALRTEVRDGDTAVGSHERAELSGFGKTAMLASATDERWYEFDVKFGESGTFSPTWSGGSNDWLIFFQWHQVNDPNAPALAMSMHSDGKVYLEREPDSDFEFLGPLWTPAADTWYRVVVHVMWSPDSTIGFVQVYVDDVEVLPITFRKTQYAADTADYYPKLGTYRRSTVNGTTVLFHDNVRISGPPASTGTTSSNPPSGVLKYRVYRDGTLYAEVPSNASTATALVDLNVSGGTTYSYTVSAVDGALNESSQSSSASVTLSGPSAGGVALLPGRLTNGKIEVSAAWGANLAADEATWAWSDITSDVRFHPGISTALGRNDESSTSNPASLTVVLDNSAGAYSLGVSSAHYPYVRRGTPIRVRVNPGTGGARVMFLGFADGFTPGWDSLKGTLPIVTLSASGTLRRLSQGSAPLQSAYRRVMTASPAVVAYWPLEDGKSSTFAYPVKGGSVFSYTGGSPSWASDTSFDCSDALPTIASAAGSATVTAYANTGKTQVRHLLSIPDNGLTDGTVLWHVWTTGTISRWGLTYEVVNGAPAFGLFRLASDGTEHSNNIIGFPGLNGKFGRLSLDLTQSGSDIAWTLSFTPATPTGATTNQYFQGTITGKTAGIVSRIEINPHNANISATIGHLTVENTITSLFADNDALIAYAGEANTASDSRLARLCAENRVPLHRYTGPAVDFIPVDYMGPQLVAPLLTLLRECELSGQGQLWDGRGAGLSYTTRKRREVGTVKLTIDAAAGQLSGDFAPVDDDQRDRNKVTVTRLHGTTYTYEDVSGAKGTAAIGIYDSAVTVNCAFDDSVVDFAKWFVTLGTVAGYRYPSVSVDLAASPSLAGAVLDIIPGERINVTNLNTALAQFPDSTVSLIVEGISHELTTKSWTATFRCSPYTPWATGIAHVDDSIGSLAAGTPRLTGALTGTAAVPGTTDLGALAATTPKPVGALTGSSSAGSLSDLTSQSFTDSGSLAGSYHFYGGGLPSSGAGMVVYLDGDGMYAYLNPTDNYALAGNRGLIAVAKAKGYALLVPKAPDTTGTVTWWEAGARNAQWLSELMASICTTDGIDTSKIWVVGYSGGAQVLTQHFMPLYGKARIGGGGTLALGGGAAAVSTPTGWDATFKAAVPMYWITGNEDDGTYTSDHYNAKADAAAGTSYYAGQGFTTSNTTPLGIDHEIDGSFGPMLDDLLPTLSGYSPPSRTPGTTRPTLVTSYLSMQSSSNTSATTSPSFTPSAGEVIVVKCFNDDLDSPNVATVTGGGLTYATKINIQGTSLSECWMFVAEVGATSPGSMTVSASWSGTTGHHGMVVERWNSGLVKGVPKQGGTISGSGAPSSAITPDNANSVLTWINADWNATTGTATYRSGATQTQTTSTANVRAYAAYQNSTGTGSQTMGLSAPTGQAWTLGAIEILPAP